MKILLVGEYSNVHWTLAQGLRELGHHVTVVSDGDGWKNYPRDINLQRHSLTTAGTIRYLADLARVWPQLRGYDIVQLINPVFLSLKAERIWPFYRFLRQHNGSIFLGAFGIDHYWVRVGMDCKTFRYSDFNFGSTLRSYPFMETMITDWLHGPKGVLNQRIADDCDGIITGLYEYWVCYHPVFKDKTTYIPFPIRMPASFSTERASKSKVVLFIGINRERSACKGTDIMLRAAQDLHAHYAHRMKLNIVESVPFDEYRQMIEGSDAILDQLYAYTPSMNPLLAMSKGIICIGGGEPENYEIINETELRPIINVKPTYESVYDELEQLILHPERIPELKRQSIEYVRRHHDYVKVARQYEQFYKERIP